MASLGVGTMANADLLWSKKKGSSSSVEMLQLEAKGQALAQVVVIVENVLHKMEEQVSIDGRRTRVRFGGLFGKEVPVMCGYINLPGMN